jgi:polysaccharide export outer membrane protein
MLQQTTSNQAGGIDDQRACPSVFSKFLKGAVLGLSMVMAMMQAPTLASAADYVLGPQDKLRIRVFEWRPVTGSAFEWAPLNGEFEISAAGNLSLPIIGMIAAAGRSIEQVSLSIGEQLKIRIGLQERPTPSVEVSEYRPFFITGLVSKPGKYSYSPGLTVIQALSMAGGSSGPIDTLSLTVQRESLAGRGDLRTLEVERVSLLARQARLEAILKNQGSVTFPAELLAKANLAVVARVMREEQALFDVRERTMKAQIDALNQTKVLASRQIEALNAKAASLTKQVELANKELGTVSKMVSQGLTVSSRQFGASQNLSELESRSLDVSLALLKAQQDIAKVDPDIADLRNRSNMSTLMDASEVRDRLAANAEKAETVRALLENNQARAPQAADFAPDAGENAFLTTIERSVDGALTTLVSDDNDLIAPGDLLRVTRSPTPDSRAGAPDRTALQN